VERTSGGGEFVEEEPVEVAEPVEELIRGDAASSRAAAAAFRRRGVCGVHEPADFDEERGERERRGVSNLRARRTDDAGSVNARTKIETESIRRERASGAGSKPRGVTAQWKGTIVFHINLASQGIDRLYVWYHQRAAHARGFEPRRNEKKKNQIERKKK